MKRMTIADLVNYANRLCTDGRDMITSGKIDNEPGLKRAGLRTLTEGLIQQNPLRDRIPSLNNNIVGSRGVERS